MIDTMIVKYISGFVLNKIRYDKYIEWVWDNKMNILAVMIVTCILYILYLMYMLLRYRKNLVIGNGIMPCPKCGRLPKLIKLDNECGRYECRGWFFDHLVTEVSEEPEVLWNDLIFELDED